eukprot:4526192-Pyramimonas_sp.AAC.1
MKVTIHAEWSEESQRELLLMPECDACLFGDIVDSFSPELKEILQKAKANPGMARGLLGPIVKSGVGVRLRGPQVPPPRARLQTSRGQDA